MAIFDVIKFDGLANGNWLVYKYLKNDIHNGASLIVGEGQIAIFVHCGKIADVFFPGKHLVSTENLPILRNLIELPFGGISSFPAEIYFINTVTKMDLQWGLPDPLQIIDPKYGIRMRVRSYGQSALKINDASTLLSELIGTISPNEFVSYDKLIQYFKGILITKIKTALAKQIIDNKISALEISTELENLSNKVCKSIQEEFQKYGISVVNFNIKSINVPEEDLNKLNSILEEKAAFDIIGDQRYAMRRSFDVYEGAANNANGAAGIMMAGGMGMSAGMQMMNNMGNINQNISYNQRCPGCNSEIPLNTKFCPNCGFSFMKQKCQCGAEIKPGMKFCPDCGMKI